MEKILIVEDEWIIAEQLLVTLKDLGYNVVKHVPTGEEALKLIEEEEINIVLMDIHLAGEKDGVKTAQEIQDAYEDQITIIYLTQARDNLNLNRMIQTQPENYLPKPVDPNSLDVALRIAIKKMENRAIPREPKPIVSDDDPLLKESFFFTNADTEIRINIEDIFWIMSSGSYCEIVTENKIYTPAVNLRTLREKANQPNLVRIHRQYVVNVEKIIAFDGNTVLVEMPKANPRVKNNTNQEYKRIPIGRTYGKDFFDRFNRMR